MKKHKWHDEIVAWASGAEIEQKFGESWNQILAPSWIRDAEYRIKPQPKEDWVMICKRCGDEIGIVYEPKEPQYLYVYYGGMTDAYTYFVSKADPSMMRQYEYIGKIKLEDE
jgi:hypothetical protein